MTGIVVSEAVAVNDLRPDGKRIVARFNLAFDQAVFVNGCSLIHRHDKGWTVWGPSKHVLFNKRARQAIKLAVLQSLEMKIPPQMAVER